VKKSLPVGYSGKKNSTYEQTETQKGVGGTTEGDTRRKFARGGKHLKTGGGEEKACFSRSRRRRRVLLPIGK